MAGIVSGRGSRQRLACRLAPETKTFRGRPWASTSRGYSLPSLPRSVGLAPVSAPPFRPDADRAKAGPRPVQPALLAQAVQDGLVQVRRNVLLPPCNELSKADAPA